MMLSILIVNWNSRSYLRKCLESIQHTSEEIPLQVIVVDGGSFDGCGEMLSADFPAVEFIQASDNIGFGRSNNLGLNKVKGDILLLLNPDTELKEGALRTMINQLGILGQAGMVGPRLLNTDGSLQTTCVRALPTPLNRALDSDFLRSRFPKSKLWGTYAAFRSKAPIVVGAISGACMMMEAQVFRKVGGFSEEFFMYGEDMDLCAKIRKLGLNIYYIPIAEVIHHGGGSTVGQYSQFSTIMMRKSGETYMLLHHGKATAKWYRFLQAVSAILRIMAVLPACLFLRPPAGNISRTSLKKWLSVLAWATGVNIKRP